jgi:hypothetical protein
MAKQIGSMEFWYKDYTEDEFNESVDCTYEVWGAFDGAGMPIEEYWSMCKRFALAMGYCNSLVDEWFGADY